MNQHLPTPNVAPITCPCCNQPIAVPSFEHVADAYRLTPTERRILEAIWKGRGFPVSTERIFDSIYRDDPDGGPAPNEMYRAFKVRLSRLRDKLEGTGIGVKNEGYRRGYRLVLGEK